MSSSKDLTGACDKQELERAFFLNIGNERILVNIKQQNEQDWVGPVVLPLIPSFGKKVWIDISSNRSKSEAANFSEWTLTLKGRVFSPIHVLQSIEQNFNYKTLTTLVFENDDLQKAQDFELRVPRVDTIKLRSERSWFYMPFFGGMPEPIGRCGPTGLPMFTLDKPPLGSSLIYFYRIESAGWTGRKPDVLVGDKKLFETQHLRYNKIELRPGHHQVVVDGLDMGSSKIELDTVPNGIYFLRYSAGSPNATYDGANMVPTKDSGQPQLELVSKDIGFFTL